MSFKKEKKPFKVTVNTNIEIKKPVEVSAPVVKDFVKKKDFDPKFQKEFEAPDGEIIVGDKNAQRIYYRAGDNGKGMYIRPKR